MLWRDPHSEAFLRACCVPPFPIRHKKLHDQPNCCALAVSVIRAGSWRHCQPRIENRARWRPQCSCAATPFPLPYSKAAISTFAPERTSCSRLVNPTGGLSNRHVKAVFDAAGISVDFDPSPHRRRRGIPLDELPKCEQISRSSSADRRATNTSGSS